MEHTEKTLQAPENSDAPAAPETRENRNASTAPESDDACLPPESSDALFGSEGSEACLPSESSDALFGSEGSEAFFASGSASPEGVMRRARWDAKRTRNRILSAARKLFSTASLEEVGTRQIAAAAGVDSALVNRYFGKKEALYAEAIDLELLIEDTGSLEDRDAGVMLAYWPLAPVERSEFNAFHVLAYAAGSAKARALASTRLHVEFVEPLAEMIGGDEAALRATLVAAYLMGLAVMKHAFRAPALIGNGADARAAAVVGAAIERVAVRPERESSLD